MKTNALTLALLTSGLMAPLPFLAQCCGGGASTTQGFLMAKASWLQTGTTIMNPYFGKAMPHCGQFKS